MKRGHTIEKYLFSWLLLFVLAGCSTSTQPTTPSAQGPIKVGLSISKAGDFAQDGGLTLKGYQLWADNVNQHGGLLGRQVQLVVKDDASKPEQAATDYQQLINVDKVDLLLGPFGFEVVPAARVAQRFNYPFVEGTNTAVDVYTQGLSNLFVVSLPAAQYLSSFANYILSLPVSMRPKSAVYTSADDTFTRPPVDIARQLLEKGGIKTLDYIKYADETQDFGPIAQRVINSKAQLVVSGTLSLTDCQALINSFKQQHYNPAAAIFSTGPDQGGDFIKAVGLKATNGVFVPNGGWYPGIKTYQNDEFQQAYVAKYHGTADAISSDSVQAFSAGQVLAQAVTKAGSLDHTAILKVLHDQNQTYTSLQGAVKFGPNGANTASIPFLFQWQNGTLVPVFPSNQAQANPEFPKPAWS